jgi:hypothetical protein
MHERMKQGEKDETGTTGGVLPCRGLRACVGMDDERFARKVQYPTRWALQSVVVICFTFQLGFLYNIYSYLSCTVV